MKRGTSRRSAAEDVAPAMSWDVAPTNFVKPAPATSPKPFDSNDDFIALPSLPPDPRQQRKPMPRQFGRDKQRPKKKREHDHGQQRRGFASGIGKIKTTPAFSKQRAFRGGTAPKAGKAATLKQAKKKQEQQRGAGKQHR